MWQDRDIYDQDDLPAAPQSSQPLAAMHLALVESAPSLPLRRFLELDSAGDPMYCIAQAENDPSMQLSTSFATARSNLTAPTTKNKRHGQYKISCQQRHAASSLHSERMVLSVFATELRHIQDQLSRSYPPRLSDLKPWNVVSEHDAWVATGLIDFFLARHITLTKRERRKIFLKAWGPLSRQM